MKNNAVKKALARVASNRSGTNQTEESHNFQLNHDHQYISVKSNEQQQQDEGEMNGDDNNSIITLSSTHSSTSDLMTKNEDPIAYQNSNAKQERNETVKC